MHSMRKGVTMQIWWVVDIADGRRASCCFFGSLGREEEKLCIVKVKISYNALLSASSSFVPEDMRSGILKLLLLLTWVFRLEVEAPCMAKLNLLILDSQELAVLPGDDPRQSAATCASFGASPMIPWEETKATTPLNPVVGFDDPPASRRTECRWRGILSG